MTKGEDLEIRTMRTVYNQLTELGPRAQARVIQWVIQRLNAENPQPLELQYPVSPLTGLQGRLRGVDNGSG